MPSWLIICACSVLLAICGVWLATVFRRPTFNRDGTWTRFCSVGRDCLLSQSAGQFVVSAYDREGNALSCRRLTTRDHSISFAQFLFGQDRLGDLVRLQDSPTALTLESAARKDVKKGQVVRVEIQALTTRPAKAALWVVRPCQNSGRKQTLPKRPIKSRAK